MLSLTENSSIELVTFRGSLRSPQQFLVDITIFPDDWWQISACEGRDQAGVAHVNQTPNVNYLLPAIHLA
jgi:hypothetical protein